MKSYSESYKEAGVDITAGYRAVELMQQHIARTKTPGVVSDIGGFGGLFAPDMKKISEPILVSGTDGVGTKLRLAFVLDKHDTIGIDCVAMCVNDIICCGAEPMFFLDYISCGKTVPEKIEQIVAGISEGCVQAGVALIGGETAEMPGFYPEDEYDLAGFAVGIVDRKEIISSSRVQNNDAIIALPSTGVHSNGFSLVRKVFNINKENHQAIIKQNYGDLGMSLGEALLVPTQIYVKAVLQLISKIEVHAISHITGGGFYENIPRSMPEGLMAKIERQACRVLPIFDLIQQQGHISERDMFNTFNMGAGMTICVAKDDADAALNVLQGSGIDAWVIGEVVKGEDGVLIC